MASKRKRDPTFVSSEKSTLLHLVEKHFNIIENKKTDAVSVKQKNEEWQKIANEFNSASSIHPRDWAVLKNCWENLKKRAKQINIQRNQHFSGTGGPPKKICEDPAVEKALDIIRTRLTGYVNCFDSDGTVILATGSASATQTQVLDPLLDENLSTSNDTVVSESHMQADDIEPFAVDWLQYTPSIEAVNPVLVRSRSPSPEPNNEVGAQEQQQTHSTPLRAHRTNTNRVSARASTTGGVSTDRRRPTLRRDTESQSLTTERIKALLMAKHTHAEEEHVVHMNILRYQEQREKELLSQEKFKTEQEKIKLEILKLELVNKKK